MSPLLFYVLIVTVVLNALIFTVITLCADCRWIVTLCADCRFEWCRMALNCYFVCWIITLCAADWRWIVTLCADWRWIVTVYWSRTHALLYRYHCSLIPNAARLCVPTQPCTMSARLTACVSLCCDHLILNAGQTCLGPSDRLEVLPSCSEALG